MKVENERKNDVKKKSSLKEYRYSAYENVGQNYFKRGNDLN